MFLHLEQLVLSRSVQIKLTQLVEGESQTQMCSVCVLSPGYMAADGLLASRDGDIMQL